MFEPRNMTSMRVAYGDSNVLRCNLELAYDRFITNFNYQETQQTVGNSSSGVVNSNDILSVTEQGNNVGQTINPEISNSNRGTHLFKLNKPSYIKY